MTLPPGMMWPGWEWWCHLKAADQGAWASAIATAAAGAIALWLGVRDGLRRRSDSKQRGRVAMALIAPEVARIQVVLTELLSDLDSLGKVAELGDPDGVFSLIIDRIETVGCELDTPLLSHDVSHYVDMPARLRFNLPTVVHTLPQLVTIAGPLRKFFGRSRGEELVKDIRFYRDFADSTLIDFNAALDYLNKKIVPLQHRNMRKYMTPEQRDRINIEISRGL